MSRTAGAVGLTLLLGLFTACAKKGEGEPCSSTSECASGLTCDRHGQKTGKCLGEHGHGTTPQADAAAVLDSGATGGTGGGQVGADAAGGATATEVAPAAPDAAAEVAPAADTRPDTGGSDSGGSQACAAYCQCMAKDCAKSPGYPFATEAACLTRCGQLTAQELSCWSGFCAMAGMQSPALKEHTCEHAWGAHGTGECP